MTMEEFVMEKKNCTAAVVLGIVGIILGLFIPILGIGCGVAGIVVCSMKKEECNTRSGLILSIVAVVLSVVSWIAGAIMLAAIMSA